MMRGRLALLGGCVLGVVVGSEARAASLLDGTPGMLTGWAGPIGFVSVVDNSFAPASAGTGYRMLLSTGTNEDHDRNPAVDAPAVGLVEAYVGAGVDVGGTAGFDAGPAVEGSAVRRTFTATAGDVVRISFDFLTAEASAMFSGEDVSNLVTRYVNDFAFVAISHGGETTVTRIADVLTPGMTEMAGDRFLYHTGFRTLSLTLPPGADVTDGTYVVALGVMDGGWHVDPERGHIGESALLIESIEVNGPSAVPLPAAAPAGVALIGALAAVRRFRRVR